MFRRILAAVPRARTFALSGCPAAPWPQSPGTEVRDQRNAARKMPFVGRKISFA